MTHILHYTRTHTHTYAHMHTLQDASLKMYLCCLLRKAPVVTEAIVTGVNGNRWISVYLTGYGISSE